MDHKKEQQKQQAARAAADYIKEGMTIGLGSGTTSRYLIREAGKRYGQGLHFYGIATSRDSEQLAASLGIPLLEPEQAGKIHLAIDGVDEIDREFRAVKGGGGALLREKIIASWAEEVIWIMDESKLVERLGAFPFPVETVPFGMPFVNRRYGSSSRPAHGRWKIVFDGQRKFYTGCAVCRKYGYFPGGRADPQYAGSCGDRVLWTDVQPYCGRYFIRGQSHGKPA